MIQDWQATRRQCYQDNGPFWSPSWMPLPTLLVWQENAGKATLYIWSKSNAPDSCESKIHFSWLSYIDPNLDQYFRITTFTKSPRRSSSTQHFYFAEPACIKTLFLEDSSSCLALDFLQHLVNTFCLLNHRTINKKKKISRGAASEAKENVEPSILSRTLAQYE